MGRVITIIMALVGIGIFAIPAALLASAFSDQLIKEREALRHEIYVMLKDGYISEEEAVQIRIEANRLHLTVQEVNQLIQTVLDEHEARLNREGLSIATIAASPELAIEHYKSLMGQIRQLKLLTDDQKFQAIADQNDLLTQAERMVWTSIKKAEV